jgi:pSer/pThr/pTyr-binding forkhead associated (FHA) protein
MQQQVNPEFMYGGQPGAAQQFGASPAVPAAAAPPDPFAATSAAMGQRATLTGAAGTFTIMPGGEMRAGRDGSQCAILLSEPRVSGVHATLKIENGQLWVRDENSNNGTMVNGNPLGPAVWTPVPNGSLLRFGPVEFSVRIT